MKKVLHLLAAMALLLNFMQVKAQESVVIGTGTGTSYTYPFCNYYRYSTSQTLYKSSEIGEAGVITKIAYNVATTGSNSTSDLRIYMGHKSSSDYTATMGFLDEISNLTLVWSTESQNFIFGKSKGWLEFELQTPFAYNGVDNLVIVIAHGYLNYNNKLTFYNTSSTGTHLYRQNDGNSYYSDIANTTNYNVASERPNIKIDIKRCNHENIANCWETELEVAHLKCNECGLVFASDTVTLLSNLYKYISEDGYYELSNAAQLCYFRDLVNSGKTLINARLMDDISVNSGVLTGGKLLSNTSYFDVWNAIGTSVMPYNGNFDGNGHVVSGLCFNNEKESYVSLFGYTGSSAIIKDVTVADSYFNGYNYVGGIVGFANNSKIINCACEGIVSGEQYVGGIVGYANNSKIINCACEGIVSGEQYVGGIVGYKYYGTVTDCHNKANVDANIKDYAYVGGIAGRSCYSTISNSTNEGKVTSKGYYIGGIAGHSENDNIYYCSNSGAVCTSNNDYAYAGGISGYSTSSIISDCYNTGSISSESVGSNYAAGIAGYTDDAIVNCYNKGRVTGAGNYVGSIAGKCENIMENCYYLKGNATDGSGKEQNGIGATSVGLTVEDNGVAVAVSNSDFSSGKVAFLLNRKGSDENLPWRQNLDSFDADDYPILDKSHRMVYASHPCTSAFSNTEGAVSLHMADINGYCSVCGEYMEPEHDENGVYLIAKAGDLYWFVKTVNSGNTYINAKLTNDIEINSSVLGIDGNLRSDYATAKLKEWTPIGGDYCQYNGTFDGNGHVISGLYVNNENKSYVGLFGVTSEYSTVKNLTVEDSYFNGCQYVGGIAGYIYGAVVDCHSQATVNSNYSKNVYIGGITGYSYYGTIDNSTNEGKVTSKGYNVGGIAGYNDNGSIVECSNSGSVYSSYTGSAYTGGIAGYSYYDAISKSYNTGKVWSKGYYVGGITGSNYKGEISDCYNTGSISSEYSSSSCVAGIAGYNNSTINNCYNTGEISGASCYVGSIVGQNDATLQNCYYLQGTATDGNKIAQNGIGTNNVGNVADDVYTIAVSADDFESGKVAFLLNDKSSSEYVAWHQTLSGSDVRPTLDASHGIVYSTYPCPTGYSNSSNLRVNHSLGSDGKCIHCGQYNEPNLVDGVYQIANLSNLYWFANKVNSGSTNINGKLVADIAVNYSVLTSEGDLRSDYATANLKGWTPIGSYSYQYNGTFDGNGHAISGLYFNNEKESVEYVGLFGYTGSSATVKNVTVENSYFNGCYVGGIVAVNLGSITNCHNKATVNVNLIGDLSYAGGIAGYTNNGTISQSTNDGIITSKGYYTGGIVGYNANGSIVECSNSGSVYSYYIGSAYVGGIAGYSSFGSQISKSYNTGRVSSMGYYAGGIAGYNDGEISNCFNTSFISSEYLYNSYVAGVAGYNNSTIKNCYNTGEIAGESCYVGSIVGQNDATLQNCYYLQGTATDGNGKVQAGIGSSSVGYSNSDNASTVAEPASDFASGKVTFLLNGSTASETVAWRQNLGGKNADKTPVLDLNCSVVYQTSPCHKEYSNEAKYLVHKFEDGICSYCGVFDVPELISGVYQIANAGNLYWFANKVNSGNANINGKLVADIVVNKSVLTSEGDLRSDYATANLKEWTPIGGDSYQYNGTFDGNGKTISGLYFNNKNKSYVGLFGYATSGAIIKNVGVEDSYFNGYSYVGGIVGYKYYGTVTDCHSNATVNANYSYYSYAGGIAGYASYGTISNCYNTGKVWSNGYYVGGIAGYNYGEISNCYNRGTISAEYSGNSSVAGIAGYHGSNTIKNCYNTGEVTGVGYYVGSIVGQNAATLQNCYYLQGTATDGNGKVQAGIGSSSVGYSNSDNANTVAESVSDFASGKVTFLLNGSTANESVAWRQNLGDENTDKMPVLDPNRSVVYQTSPCNMGYSNVKYLAHNIEDGICTYCGELEVPELISGVYQIANAGNLYWFANKVNSGSISINGKLVADIVVNKSVLTSEGDLRSDYATANLKEWTPVGSYSYQYNGTFDGNGKTISGLYFNNENKSYVGLFGYTASDVTIKNVGVEDSYFNGYQNVGSIVGYKYYGTVTDCHSNATVKANYSSNAYAGGIAGYAYYGTISKSHNTGRVSAKGYDVGGIAGYSYSEIINCYNTGSISSEYSYGSCVAGIAGYNGKTISNCYNVGEVAGAGYYVGSIAGENGSTLQNCHYLAGTATDGNGKVQTGTGSSSVGYSNSDNASTVAESASDFASGKVTFLLNGSTASETVAWRQNLDDENADKMPVLDSDHGIVYRSEPCIRLYANSPATGTNHYFENGLCGCGEIEEPAVDGTEYLIANAGNLYWFANKVNSGSTNINGKLVADIAVNYSVLTSEGDLRSDYATANLKGWTPIGSYSYRYNGTFDGNGHAISGLYFNNENQSYVGLFGYTASGATIKNVGVEDSYFNGYSYVGGIVGYKYYGTVTDCHSNATVNANYSYYSYAGGIAGYASYGTISNCYNTGKVWSNGYYVGGISGYNYDEISNCYNTGAISSEYWYGSCVAGIAGYHGSNTIKNCYSTGEVTGVGYYVGSIVGQNNATLQNCYYLQGTAADGNGTVQNGVGANSEGSNVGDNANTVAKTASDFVNGKVAYLLNGSTSEGSLVWYQTLSSDKEPVLDNTHGVIYVSAPCPAKTSNAKFEGVEVKHQYVGGICKFCGAHDMPEIVSLDNCNGFGLTTDYLNYYAIENEGHLFWFAQYVNDGNSNVNAVLVNDIKVNGKVLANGLLRSDYATANLKEWTPIGSDSYQYNGTFDGNGKTISGLYFNNENQSYIGLFGYTASDVTIKNVGVEDSYFNGYQNVGSIVGYKYYGTVTDCHSNATVKANYSSNAYAGGIAGYAYYGTISKSHNTGRVSAKGYDVGGIAGYSYSEIINCYNTGSISSEYSYGSCVAGIAGYNGKTISNCYNVGEVAGAGYYVGSIAGENGSTLQNCHYLAGTATDGNGTVQNGVGATSKGLTVEDNNDVTAVSNRDISSGNLTFMLNGQTSNGDLVWFQTLGADKTPLLDNTHNVVYYSQPCPFTFSNSIVAETTDHVYGEDGFCKHCGLLMKVDESNYSALELDKSYIGYHVISTVDNLKWFADQVNSGNVEINGVVVADIAYNDSVLTPEGDLRSDYATANLKEWTPVGSYSYQYNGTFDGNGKTISGLYFNSENQSYIGLFGYTASDVTIKNVGVEDSYFNGYQNVGGIVGYKYYGAVTDCYSNATVNANYSNGSYAGGIAGYAYYGTISNCYNTGKVWSKGYYVGGISGYNYGEISNCYNTGSISAEYWYGSYVAGIAGYHGSNTIKNCYNTGEVTGVGYYVGSIVGSRYGTLQNCYYMEGTASDGNGTVQNGVGAYSNGSNATDDANTIAKSENEFETGQVAYLLNEQNSDGDLAWFQTLGSDVAPVLDDTHNIVVLSCSGSSYSNTYDHSFDVKTIHPATCSNVADTVYVCETCNFEHIAYGKTKTDHNFVDGVCEYCHQYMPAELSYMEGYNGYYVISNAIELFWFAQQVNSGNTKMNGVLACDIIVNDSVLTPDGDLRSDYATANLKEWTPIGSDPYQYNGTFDGNGKTISGLYFNENQFNVGLFGYASSDATVKNVTIENSYFSGYQYVGGIIGYNSYGTITDCHSSATVNSNCTYIVCVGGIAGYSYYGTISKSHNTGRVSAKGYDVGGIAGCSYGEISNCYNTGSISSEYSSNSCVAGIAGYNGNTISNCYNVGEVAGAGFYVGSIAGENSSTLQNCHYLAGTATDGNGTVQNGVGATTLGTVASDGETIVASTMAEFKSGKVAYMLNGTDQGKLVWFQTLETSETPQFSGSIISKICLCDSSYAFSNTTNKYVLHVSADSVVNENIIAKATCTTAKQHDEVTYCTHCKGISSRKTVIEQQPLGHDTATKNENTIAATCTAPATHESVSYCRRCNIEFSRELVQDAPALGHKGDSISFEKHIAATCVKAGSYDSVVYCKVCKSELNREKVIVPASGHKADSVVITNVVAATCTTAGSQDTVTYCKVCNDVVSTKHATFAALGHKAGDFTVEVKKEATCTRAGMSDSVQYCTVCTNILKRVSFVVPALGHKVDSFAIKNVVKATCDREGSYDTVFYCTVCGNKVSSKKVKEPALGHNFVDHVCTICDYHQAVVAIAITTLPKTDYVVGEKFDASGAVITVTYEDGSKDTVELDESMLKNFSTTFSGENEVTVKYGGSKATFKIKVVTADINIWTAIDANNEAATDVNIFAYNRVIVVETVEASDADIFIFDINGQMIAKQAATGNRTEFEMQSQGIYIVRIGETVKRVVLY